MSECIFCKIANGQIPSEFIYEDDKVVAFADINPIAPVHILVISRRHFDNILKAAEQDPAELDYMVQVVPKIAIAAGLADDGFRIVINTNDDGGQTVKHLHWHIIGGRFMKWPPG